MSDDTPRGTGWRDRLLCLVDSRTFNNAIIGIIVLNSIVIGLQTSNGVVDEIGGILDVLDTTLLTIFVIELIMRLIAYGSGFLKRPWSVFDFVVIGIALTPGAEAFSVVRALRILRALRLISQVPTMRVVVEALIRSLPGLGSTAILLMLIFYVGGVMTTVLFKTAFPEFFGDLGASIYSLFQVMTLESWSMGIVRPVMAVYPYAWVFFVPFIIITSMLVLNLVVAIVVDSMQSAKEMMAEEGRIEREASGVPAEATLESLQLELRALRDEVRALRVERDED
jgi:voltage-gated sodium channel